jgi:hypothetical protein
MSYHKGYSTRLPDDPCAYNKRLSESTGVYAYVTYDGMYENCNRCVYDHYTRPFDADIIDVDSELSNRTRPASKCPSRKYNPRCKKSPNCLSTFDDSVPVVLAPEVCEICPTNIHWGLETGIRDPKPSNCKGFALKRRKRGYNGQEAQNVQESVALRAR